MRRERESKIEWRINFLMHFHEKVTFWEENIVGWNVRAETFNLSCKQTSFAKNKRKISALMFQMHNG
jgi:hypothetical protein